MQWGGDGSKPSKRQIGIFVSLVQIVPRVGKIKYFKAKKEKNNHSKVGEVTLPSFLKLTWALLTPALARPTDLKKKSGWK